MFVACAIFLVAVSFITPPDTLKKTLPSIFLVKQKRELTKFRSLAVKVTAESAAPPRYISVDKYFTKKDFGEKALTAFICCVILIPIR